jgi:FkbM family methyltransferase
MAVIDSDGVRQRILASARRMGLEPQLRRAQDAFTPRSQLRNRRDDAHLCAIMAAILPREANCIDIGANAGDVLREMVRLAPAGHHIAYEPLPELAGSLAERFPGVDVRNAAVWETPGEATFYRDTASDSRSSLRPSEGCEPFTVRLNTLDLDLPEGYRPHFVKIDVEGAELGVLRSGAETLARHRPHIAFEHGSSARAFGTTHRMIHDFLAGELGMRIFDMDGQGPLSADEFDLVADPPGDRWNFIACP